MVISLETLNQIENWLRRVEPKKLKNEDNTRVYLGVQKFVIDNKLETIKENI